MGLSHVQICLIDVRVIFLALVFGNAVYVAYTLEHNSSNTKFMGSISRESKN